MLRVRRALAKWREIGATSTLIKVIQEGVKVPMVSIPGPSSKSTRGQVDIELDRLKSIGVARVLDPVTISQTTTWTPVFGVPKPSGKVRLMLSRAWAQQHPRTLHLLDDEVRRWAAQGDRSLEVALGKT